MKSMPILGLAFLAVGIAMLASQGITYTRQEQIAQLGRLRITTEERKSLPLPPLAGAAAVGLGAILIVVGVRRG